LAYAHADGTEEKKIATTEFLDHVQTREGRRDVDTVRNDLDNEGALETGVQEVLSTVVNWVLSAMSFVKGDNRLTDEVYTGQLLQGLEKTSSHQSLAKSTLEAFGIRRFTQRQFVDVVGLHFVELFDDSWVIDR
jgi:hypothetical protein